MSEKVKILYIHHGTGIGGAPISLLNLIKNLDLTKYSVKIAALKDGDHVRMFRNGGFEVDVIGASTMNFAFNESRKKKWYYLPYYLAIFFVWLYTAYFVAPRYLKSQHVNIIHLNSHVLTSWAFAARKLKFKVLIHNREAIARGYFGFRYNILKYLIKKNCDYIINISRDNKNRLGIRENSEVVYNFVDIPVEFKEPFSNLRDKKHLLYLGGSSSIKGYDCLLDCLQYLDDNIVIEVAGHVNLRENELAKEVASGKVIILGVLVNPYPYIDNCDVMISPFKRPHFSRPAIEAFAYGKPVIGSDVKGMDEIIDNNINGLLFENGNPKSLANAINYMCRNISVSRAMGRNARIKALKQFSPTINIEKIETIYQKLI